MRPSKYDVGSIQISPSYMLNMLYFLSISSVDYAVYVIGISQLELAIFTINVSNVVPYT